MSPRPRRLALRATVALVLAGLTSAAWGQERPGRAADAVEDLSGHAPRSAGRLICVGGAVTETVFALGWGEQVVAVDKGSTFPVEATVRTSVGYQRTLSAEGLLTLRPTLVLASEEAGPAAVLQQLEAMGVDVVSVPSTPGVEGAVARLEIVASALGRAERGRELGQRLREQAHAAAVVAAKASAERPGGAPRALLLYARGAGALHVGGRGTPAHEILALAGVENAAADIEGWKPLTPEAAVACAPDVLVVPSTSIELLGGVDRLLAEPGLSLTAAGSRHAVLVLDAQLMLGFGPRTAEAIAAVSEGILAATAVRVARQP